MSKLLGVYPGSFDPLTIGHLDIIKRSASFVDKLIIGVGYNSTKKYLLSTDERIAVINNCLKDELPKDLSKKIEIKSYEGLLVDFVKKVDAKLIIRGLRALSDFEFEFNLAGGNQMLDSNIETIFLMTSINKQFVSSKLVKEIYKLNGDISQFVPKTVLKYITNNK